MSKLVAMARREEAAWMIRQGFKNVIIKLYAGVADSMVRSLRSEIEASGGLSEDLEEMRGQLKHPVNVINLRQRMLEGGILLDSYLKYAKDPSHEVDIHALVDAYELYTEIHKDIWGRRNSPLNINEAFSLVRELRSGDGVVMLHKCTTHGCGVHYVSVVGQRMQVVCPVCTMT